MTWKPFRLRVHVRLTMRAILAISGHLETSSMRLDEPICANLARASTLSAHCAARLIRTLMMTTLRASRGTIFSLDVLRFIADSNTERLAEEVKPYLASLLTFTRRDAEKGAEGQSGERCVARVRMLAGVSKLGPTSFA